MKRVAVAALAALAALGVACQSASDPPQDPVWDKQTCSSCAMLVSAPRFAAQLLTPAGDHLYFDDIGCMAAYLTQRKSAAKRTWVRDGKGNWLSTDVAHFAKGAKTPMDYGFAYSETGDLPWSAVLAAARERPKHGSEP